MVAVAQAMGGPRAGTALMSAAQQFLGGTTTQRTAKAAQKYGLVGDYDVGRGGQVQFRDGSLNTPFIKALREDPLEAMKIAQKALYDAGKKNVEEQVPELYKIFGRQTTQRMMHDLLRNMPQIEAERKRLKGAMGTGDADATANEQDISKNIHNLSAAWKDFQATLGNSPMVVSALQSITGAIKGMTDWAQANPGTMDVMRQAMIGLAAGLTALGVALGGAALVAFAGTGGLIVAGIAGVAAALAALAAVNWEGVSGAVKGMDSWLESWRGMGTKMAQDLYASLPSGNDIARAFIAVGKGISDAINSLAKTIGSAFDAVVSAIARGAAAIKNIFGGSPGPSAPGASAGAVLGSALAGKRAMGGPVNWGAPYLVGENGPEVFVPRGSGDIIPNHRLAGVGAPPRGGQAQESHHHIYIDGEQVHRVVERRMIASATHPSGPSLFNGESMWAPPDMQYAAA